MLISCPNCSTNFSVPDKALGARGRTLKCAKCGHKWFQSAGEAEPDMGLDLDLSGPSFTGEPEPEPAPEPIQRPTIQAGIRVRKDADLDMDMDEPPIPDFGTRLPPEERSAERSGLLDDDRPQPIPDVFAQHPAEEKKGTGFLWFMMLLLMLGGIGGGAFYFQDKVIELVPEFGEVLGHAGLRREKPGAGLQLRSAGTPERFVHNDTEVLIVRGIIANVSERARQVPTMKLVLLDKDKKTVQEKMSQPPVTALDPQGTASFKIMLERPDPNAVEVNVVFVDPNEVK